MKGKKEDKKNEDTSIRCQVCFLPQSKEKPKPTKNKQADMPERRRITQLYHCITCKQYVHKNCYDPSLHQPKNFKCDTCKLNSKNKPSKKVCLICQKQGGMLKQIQQNKFAHILCAISSDIVILQDFKTMKFKMNNQYKLKEMCQKQKNHIKCRFCQNGSATEGLFKCYAQDCNLYAHLQCQKTNAYSNGQQILYNLWEYNEGYFRLRNAEFLKKNNSILKGIEMLQKTKKTSTMITCSKHTADIKWCTVCNTSKDPFGTVECARCYRWIHSSCARMKNGSQQAYFQCNACMDQKKSQQGIIYPQFIFQMVKLQTSQSGKWSKQDLKFLDCFPFKCSQLLYSQILKHREEFENYQLYQYIQQFLENFDKKNESVEKILQKITNKDYKLFCQKKIIEIVYFIKNNQLRKLGQLNSVSQINDLRKMYPCFSKKSAQKAAHEEKLKKFFQKVLDIYVNNIKQAELKDISMKLVQFSDKIRKQIVNIQQNQFVSSSVQNLPQPQKRLAISELLKKRPHQIAIDLRELLGMLSKNKQKLRGKIEFEPPSFNSQKQNVLNENISKNTNLKTKEGLNNNFLMMLIRCIISKDAGYENQVIESEDLEDLIDSYRKIIYISKAAKAKPSRNLTLPEEELFKILNKSYDLSKTKLSEQSRVRICKFFKNLINEYKIKQHHELKFELSARYDKLIHLDGFNYNQALIMRQNIAQQGLFIDKNSNLLKFEKRSTYFKVLKIKYMKIVNLQNDSQHANQVSPIKINQKNRKDILQNVRRILESNNKCLKLTQQQKKSLEYFLVKEQVFSNILHQQNILGSKLDAYTPVEDDKIELQVNDNNEDIQRKNSNLYAQNLNGDNINSSRDQNNKKFTGPLTILQRIKRIFAYWVDNSIKPYQIIKILYPISQKKIHFSLQYQTAFNDIIQSLGTRYNIFLQTDQHLAGSNKGSERIHSDQFIKLWKLIEYAGIQKCYEKLKNLNDEYRQWLQSLQTKFNPIAKVLQDKYKIANLLQVIDSKISDAQNLQIDLKVEVKKLKLVKLWAVLSQKFQKDFQRKPTINAIQQFKNLMIKISYPHNQIYKKVLDLEEYGRKLNEKIQKYLKKQSRQQQLQFYEQITLIDNKMTLKEAEQLKAELQNSKLDVSAELQTLEDQITNFNQIPTKLEPIFKKSDNLSELVKIKSQILEISIKYQNLQGYCQIIHRINFLKCQNLQQTVTRKQFQKLLSSSDLGVLKLTQKMPLLLKGYREIQRAEKQVLSVKPRFQLLLPADNKKLRLQLAQDPTTLRQLDYKYSKVEALKQKFNRYKKQRVEFQKYLMIQYEMSHYPINYKDLVTEISRMKHQLNNLLGKAEYLKKNFNPSQAKEIVKAYNNLGVRHQDLQQIKKIYESLSICMSLSQREEDYVQFSHKCKQYQQLSSIIKLNELRGQLFDQYSDQILQRNGQVYGNTILSMLQALIQQGSFILNYTIPSSKHYFNQRNNILQKILRLNNKVGELTKSSSKQKKHKRVRQSNDEGDDLDNFNDDDQIQNSNQYEDQQDHYEDGRQLYDEDDIEYDDDFDDDDESQDYGQDDQEMPQRVSKRSHPEVMEISDEDDKPQPEQRKVPHLNPVQAAPATVLNEAGQVVPSSQQVQNVSSSENK